MKMQRWEASLLTNITIVIMFQSIAEVMSTLVIGLIMLAGFFESFVAFGKGSLNSDTTELSAIDVLCICQPSTTNFSDIVIGGIP
jgi:hypothetical protein